MSPTWGPEMSSSAQPMVSNKGDTQTHGGPVPGAAKNNKRLAMDDMDSPAHSAFTPSVVSFAPSVHSLNGQTPIESETFSVQQADIESAAFSPQQEASPLQEDDADGSDFPEQLRV